MWFVLSVCMALEAIVEKASRFAKRTLIVGALSFAGLMFMGVNPLTGLSLANHAVRDQVVLSGSFCASRLLKERRAAEEEDRFPHYGEALYSSLLFGGLIGPFIHSSYEYMNALYPVDTIPQMIESGTVNQKAVIDRVVANAAVYPAVGALYAAPVSHISDERTSSGIMKSFSAVPKIAKAIYMTVPLILGNIFLFPPGLQVVAAAGISFVVEYFGFGERKKKVRPSYGVQPQVA
ncbi:MAG: hypothetical protein ABIC95_02455 [archaeon]